MKNVANFRETNTFLPERYKRQFGLKSKGNIVSLYIHYRIQYNYFKDINNETGI